MGKTKGRKKRDLSKAVDLRPADIFDLYGIPSSTLCKLCNHPNPDRRVPSKLIPGKSGRKGVRLINRVEFEAYLSKFKTHAA